MKTPGKKTFTSLKNLCKETNLRDFQFKLIHGIIVTKKELCRFGIKADDDCLHCGKKDSVDHSSKDCRFVIPSILRLSNGSMQEIIQILTHPLKKNFLA